jgi:hypothetical protein
MADDSFVEDVQADENLQGVRTGSVILLVGSFVVILINGIGLVGAFMGKPKLLVAVS